MDGSLKVKAPIPHPGDRGPTVEHLHAQVDPAAENQAILHNTPFFVDYLNFGDIVRVGEGEDSRPILEVVHASGHRRIQAFTGTAHPQGLSERLHGLYADHEIKLEGSDQNPDIGLMVVSIHPDVDAERVWEHIADWLDDNGQSPDTASVSPPLETQLGPVDWPEGGG